MEAAPDKRALGRALVEAVDGLHAERSKQVLMARELRTRGEHAEREAVWERVQELTLQIEQSERDLEALGGRAAALAEAEDGEEVGTRADRRAAKKAVRWHAPRYEDWPDVNVDVVVLCQYPELKTPVVKRAFHDCNCWRGSDSSRPLRCEVIGWMTDDEALRLLGKAVRHG